MAAGCTMGHQPPPRHRSRLQRAAVAKAGAVLPVAAGRPVEEQEAEPPK